MNRLRIQHKKGLVLLEEPAPKEINKKKARGASHEEDPGTNIRRYLKGAIFSAILYDAIKLAHKTK
ncbi:MAG: hypothetical protein ACYTFI_00215 [Planctomycetota bacterium]